MQDRFKFKVKFEIDGQVEIFDVIDISFEYQQVFFRRQDNMVYNIGLGVKGVELIQCSGLKDKNGKLIYQEDIVRDTSTQTVYKVSYKKCVFYLENEEYIGYFHELSKCFSISRLEVIGNIYENPDLLKVA